MNRTLLLFILLTVGIFSACASRGYYVSRSAPPPPRFVGVIGRPPGAGYVWTDGYWAYRRNNWDWVQGSWVRPPRARAVWVPGAWRPVGRGYRFYPGHWR